MNKIPIETAKSIAKQCGLDGVLILGLDKDNVSYRITTYGIDKPTCNNVRTIGSDLATMIENEDLDVEI